MADEENPWARKAPPPPPPDDGGGAEGGDAGASAPPVATPYASYTRPLGRGGVPRPIPVATAAADSAAAPPVAGKALARGQSTQRLAPAPPAGEPAASAESGGGGGWCGTTGACAAAAHRRLVRGNACGACFLLALTLLCFSLFGYSLYLLEAHPTLGSGCDAMTCVAGVSDSGTCVGVPTGGETPCAAVCTLPDVLAVSPFRYTLPAAGGATGSASTLGGLPAAVYCPFPKTASNWRIPLSLFATLAAGAGAVGYCVRWRRAMGALAAALLTAGAIFFYATILDGDAVRKGAQACASRFSALSDAYAALEVTPACDAVALSAVPVIDATLALFMVSRGPSAALTRLHPPSPPPPLRAPDPARRLQTPADVRGRGAVGPLSRPERGV